MKNKVLLEIAGIEICLAGIRHYYKNRNKKNQDRYFQWYKVLYQWIVIQQDGEKITNYFKKQNYKRVAIYGAGELGKLLLRELDNTDIEIPFLIDQNAGSVTAFGKNIVTLKEVREDVDAIVVSVIDKFDAIKADVEKYVNIPVVSLEEILFSL